MYTDITSNIGHILLSRRKYPRSYNDFSYMAISTTYIAVQQ